MAGSSIVSETQLLALAYIEAATKGDKMSQDFIREEIGDSALVDALTDVSLSMTAVLVPFVLGEEMESSDEMIENIPAVLSAFRDSFLSHTQKTT